MVRGKIDIVTALQIVGHSNISSGMYILTREAIREILRLRRIGRLAMQILENTTEEISLTPSHEIFQQLRKLAGQTEPEGSEEQQEMLVALDDEVFQELCRLARQVESGEHEE